MFFTVIMQSHPVWTSYKLLTNIMVNESLIVGIKKHPLWNLPSHFVFQNWTELFLATAPHSCQKQLWHWALKSGTEKRWTVFLCSQCSSCYAHNSEKEWLELEDSVHKKMSEKRISVDGRVWQQTKDYQKRLLWDTLMDKSRKGKSSGKSVQKTN